jgi:DnaA family protein
MRQLLLDLTQAPEPTFENFVPGGNAEVLGVLRAAARGESSERVVYVWGESGAGKSHLLRSFAAAAPAAMRARVIDDVDQLDADAQAELFNAFIEGDFGFLLVSSRMAPADVPLRRDLATRLATGLTFLVEPLSDEEKRQALAAHAQGRGFDLSAEVAGYLLTHARRDMGSLISALDALDRYSLETGRVITVPLLKQALQAA